MPQLAESRQMYSSVLGIISCSPVVIPMTPGHFPSGKYLLLCLAVGDPHNTPGSCLACDVAIATAWWQWQFVCFPVKKNIYGDAWEEWDWRQWHSDIQLLCSLSAQQMSDCISKNLSLWSVPFISLLQTLCHSTVILAITQKCSLGTNHCSVLPSQPWNL